jgi:uncharacterized protein
MSNNQDNKFLIPLCDEEIDDLNDILDSLPNEDAMTLEMLDGFFTALHCCPHVILPSSCIYIILNDDDDEAEASFEDEKQFCSFLELITRYWNDVGGRLQSGEFQPFLDDVQDVGCGWSIGFLRGVMLAEGNFKPMMRDREESMVFMVVFMLAFGNDECYEDLPALFDEEITPEIREELLEGLSAGVVLLYSRFRNSGGIVTSQPIYDNKIGRNDQCPCGSGKKYKKCCLQK